MTYYQWYVISSRFCLKTDVTVAVQRPYIPHVVMIRSIVMTCDEIDGSCPCHCCVKQYLHCELWKKRTVFIFRRTLAKFDGFHYYSFTIAVTDKLCRNTYKISYISLNLLMYYFAKFNCSDMHLDSSYTTKCNGERIIRIGLSLPRLS